MNTSHPTAAVDPLPERELRAPLRVSALSTPETTDEAQQSTPNALSEALTPLISAAIARRARQRRYTP